MIPSPQPTPEAGRTLPEILAVMSKVTAELRRVNQENQGLADVLERFTVLVMDQSEILQKQARIIDGQSVELDRQQRVMKKLLGSVAEQ